MSDELTPVELAVIAYRKGSRVVNLGAPVLRDHEWVKVNDPEGQTHISVITGLERLGWVKEEPVEGAVCDWTTRPGMFMDDPELNPTIQPVNSSA